MNSSSSGTRLTSLYPLQACMLLLGGGLWLVLQSMFSLEIPQHIARCLPIAWTIILFIYIIIIEPYYSKKPVSKPLAIIGSAMFFVEGFLLGISFCYS